MPATKRGQRGKTSIGNSGGQVKLTVEPPEHPVVNINMIKKAFAADNPTTHEIRDRRSKSAIMTRPKLGTVKIVLSATERKRRNARQFHKYKDKYITLESTRSCLSATANVVGGEGVCPKCSAIMRVDGYQHRCPRCSFIRIRTEACLSHLPYSERVTMSNGTYDKGQHLHSLLQSRMYHKEIDWKQYEREFLDQVCEQLCNRGCRSSCDVTHYELKKVANTKNGVSIPKGDIVPLTAIFSGVAPPVFTPMVMNMLLCMFRATLHPYDLYKPKGRINMMHYETNCFDYLRRLGSNDDALYTYINPMVGADSLETFNVVAKRICSYPTLQWPFAPVISLAEARYDQECRERCQALRDTFRTNSQNTTYTEDV
jgi:hypothetical protein